MYGVRVVSGMSRSRNRALRKLRIRVVLSGMHQEHGMQVEGLPRSGDAGRVVHERPVHLTWSKEGR